MFVSEQLQYDRAVERPENQGGVEGQVVIQTHLKEKVRLLFLPNLLVRVNGPPCPTDSDGPEYVLHIPLVVAVQ